MIERTHPYFPLVCTGSTPAHSGRHPLPPVAADLLLGALLAQAVAYTGPRAITVRTDTDHTVSVTGETVGDCVSLAATLVDVTAGLRVTIDPEPAETALTYAFDGDLTIHCAGTPRDPAALDRLSAHYLAFLHAATTDPTRPIADVDHRTADEKRVVASLNDTAREFVQPPCLHDYIAAAVDRDPDAPALVQGATRLSYGELDALANGIARRLGNSVGQRVGVLATRGIEFAVCALGVLKAGAAYVPLDPMLPAQRLRTLFGLGRVTTLLADRVYGDVAAELTDAWLPVSIDADADRCDRTSQPLSGADLAYVIFTSGSSGRPKAVLLDHLGRSNMVADLNERFGLGPGDRMLATASPSFDMSVYDLFGVLTAGATLVFPARGHEYDVDHWARLLVDERITVWHSVPSSLTLLLNVLSPQADVSTVRLFLLGGDWMPVDQPERVHRRFPGAEIYNLGGVTEVSVYSTIYRVAPGERHARAIPYGRALANQTAHVLDRHGRDAAIEQVGELAHGGVGVACGYDRQPELTAERFVPDPFTDRPNALLYRTGDAARLRADGTVELLGRLDQQVKIQGVRIELGEIQAEIEADHRIRQAAVVPRRDDAGLAVGLVAFVVVDRGVREPGAVVSALPDRLRAALPRTSVPAEIRLIDEMPLNANGKIDRKRLDALVAPVAPAQVEAVAPGSAPAPDEYTDAVAEVWAQVLGLAEPPVAHAGFAALGGGSLAATQVVSRLRRRFDADLSVRDVRPRSTVAELAGVLRSRTGTHRHTAIQRIDG